MARTVGPDLADAFFLANHPGWSWRDLQEAPDDLIETMRLIHAARVERDKRLADKMRRSQPRRR